MVSNKKFKPTKGKKMQEFPSKKVKKFEAGPVEEDQKVAFPSKKSKNSQKFEPSPIEEGPLVPFPREKSKKAKKFEPSPVEVVQKRPFPSEKNQKANSSPLHVQKSSLKQLFKSRNASLKHKFASFSEETEVQTSSEVPLAKKRKSPEEPSQLEAKVIPQNSRQRPDRKAQRNRKKLMMQRAKEEGERLGQTVFVGNLPMNITRKELEKLFSQFGNVESVRLRGAIPVKSKIPKKVADITRRYHQSLHSRKGFVVFKNQETAEASLALNGMLVEDHHIIVDKASGAGQQKKYDKKRTIFIGNLPFDVEDETVWNAFASCGEVDSVRVIRDKTTGAGKGFGYVLFRAEDSKEMALNMENVEIGGRVVRVKSIEGGNKQKSHKNFARGRALKAKSRIDNPQSRKSTKKLLKKEKVRHDKKKVADNFKKFF